MNVDGWKRIDRWQQMLDETMTDVEHNIIAFGWNSDRC
jgi:hypothetical protein